MTRRRDASFLIRVLSFNTIELPILISGATGFCKRGENCWFLHKPDKSRAVQDEEDDEYCSICFEKAAIYGLLGERIVICVAQTDDPRRWL